MPGPVADAVKKLEDVIKAMEKQRADDRKWLLDNARRLDQMEAQVREQTLEAREYARCKCNDIDVRLRAALDDKIPKLVADSLGHTHEVTSPGAASAEAKLLVSLAAHAAKLASITDARCKMTEKYVEGSLTAQEMKLTSATEKFAERIDAFELLVEAHQSQTEQHQAYLKSMHDAKPGEEQTLMG